MARGMMRHERLPHVGIARRGQNHQTLERGSGQPSDREARSFWEVASSVGWLGGLGDRIGPPCYIVKAPRVTLVKLLGAVKPGSRYPAEEEGIDLIAVLGVAGLAIRESVHWVDQHIR